MSNAQHTPGPWQIRDNGDANSYAVIGPDGDWLLSFLHNGQALSEQQKANAQLIAAAPDLLSALLALYDYVECVWAGQYPADVAEKVRSAIKKAGESPDWEIGTTATGGRL